MVYNIYRISVTTDHPPKKSMKKRDFIKAISKYPDDAEMRIVIQTDARSLYRNVGHIRSDGETIWIDVWRHFKDDKVFGNKESKS